MARTLLRNILLSLCFLILCGREANAQGYETVPQLPINCSRECFDRLWPLRDGWIKEDEQNTALGNRYRSAMSGWVEITPGICQAGGPPPICTVAHWRKDPSQAMAAFYAFAHDIRDRRGNELQRIVSSCEKSIADALEKKRLLEEEDRKRQEADRLRMEDEKRKNEEERKQQEADRLRMEDEKRKNEEERKQQEADRLRMEDEKRKDEERKQQEADRLRMEDEKRKNEEERERQEADRLKMEDEKRKKNIADNINNLYQQTSESGAQSNAVLAQNTQTVSDAKQRLSQVSTPLTSIYSVQSNIENNDNILNNQQTLSNLGDALLTEPSTLSHRSNNDDRIEYKSYLPSESQIQAIMPAMLSVSQEYTHGFGAENSILNYSRDLVSTIKEKVVESKGFISERLIEYASYKCALYFSVKNMRDHDIFPDVDSDVKQAYNEVEASALSLPLPSWTSISWVRSRVVNKGSSFVNLVGQKILDYTSDE